MEAWLSIPDTTTARGIRDRAILEVLYSSGLRIGELLSMKVDPPDLDHRQLRVIGKGNQERVVPLGRHAIHWLEKYLAEARPVFAAYHRRLPQPQQKAADTALWLARYGGALTRKAVWMLLYRYAMRNHLPRLTPHSLRRACATHLLRHGAHPMDIQTRELRSATAERRRMAALSITRAFPLPSIPGNTVRGAVVARGQRSDRGSVSANRVKLASLCSKVRSPPCALAISRARLRPRPAPSVSRLRDGSTR